MNLQLIETELKKRWRYPYAWGRFQTDNFDFQTRFIYSVFTFESLMEKVDAFSSKPNGEALFNYALNRWYNFWSARAVEYIFSKNEKVTPATNQRDRVKDFFIENIPFDHKTSVFPKKIATSNTLYDVMRNKKWLIEWLYSNQSRQQRQHFKNRLFLIMYSNDKKHWKLKAELTLIERQITKYLNHFDKNNLCSLQFSNESLTLSDVVWIIK